MSSFKTFRISFALKNTYRVNSILYSLKQIPLIKKLLPVDLYREPGLKIFANILAGIWEFLMAFSGKFLYFVVLFLAPVFIYEGEDSGAVFLHILVLLTAIGSYMNTYIFNPGKDKYYAMFLLRMDAKEYTLVNYAYAVLKVFIGFLTFGLIFGRLAGLFWWQCILIPFFVLGMKFFVVVLSLRDYEKTGKSVSENKLDKLQWLATALLLAAAFGLPGLGFVIPQTASVIFMVLMILAGAFSLKKIWKYDRYYQIQKRINGEFLCQMDTAKTADLDRTHKLISIDAGIASKRKGYEYLNELFVKRHRRILWKASKNITLGALCVFILAIGVLLCYPKVKGDINEVVLTFLPYFTFVMYLINRGTGFTQALFINCDHCLLNYSFYKKPKHILKLFQIRLRELIKINLPPALVIGGGLAGVLYVSGGTDNLWNYVIILTSIVCMSIFFSVHYLTIYYLLQPYNAGTELKSGTYKVIMWLTYVVCYLMIQVRLSIVLFGTAVIAFCVIYCVVACILIYKFAWKTFRIRP